MRMPRRGSRGKVEKRCCRNDDKVDQIGPRFEGFGQRLRFGARLIEKATGRRIGQKIATERAP